MPRVGNTLSGECKREREGRANVPSIFVDKQAFEDVITGRTRKSIV
jgi:hypothetical protein